METVTNVTTLAARAELTTQDLLRRCAAVATTAPHPGLTARYKPVVTLEVVRALADVGYVPTSVSHTKDPYAAHMLEFSPRGAQPQTMELGGLQGRLLFENSHDGSIGARVRFGMHRLVCTNGLVVSAGAQQSFSTRHTGDVVRDILERAQRFAREGAELIERAREWDRRALSEAAAREYAQLAAQLRWGDAGRVDIAELLLPRRASDARSTLWNVFNRVQESTTRLALPATARNGRAISTRPLRDAFRDTDYNSQLWQLTEEFMEATA